MSVTHQLQDSAPSAPAATTAAPKTRSILQFEITKKKVPRRDLMHFSRQLAVFVKAGIPILDSLEAITEEMGNKKLLSIIEDVANSLRNGTTFADAMATHEASLPPYYIGILRSAELTGRLDVVLDQLAEYIDRDAEARRKVTSALAYPSVILFVALIVVVILVAFVIPKFEALFDSLGAELPLPTRLLLSITGFLTGNSLLIALAVGGLLLLGAVCAQTARGRRVIDRVLLRLPVLGDVVRHVVLERFCRILSTMMTAGVPLLDAVAVTSQATSNAVYRDALVEVRQAMVRGEGLATPLINTNLFPPAAKQMLRVGESTGTLDDQLAMAARYYERELDYKLKRFTTLFEPAVLIVVGLVVGFVAIALISAMYGVFDASRSV